MWTSTPPSYFLMKSSYVAQAALISWVSALFLSQPCEHLGLLTSAILPDHRCSLASYKFAGKLRSSRVYFLICTTGRTKLFILYTTKCPVPGKY